MKAKQGTPAPKPLRIYVELPPEYKAPFEQLAKANDRDTKKMAIHLIKTAVHEFTGQSQPQNKIASA